MCLDFCCAVLLRTSWNLSEFDIFLELLFIGFLNNKIRTKTTRKIYIQYMYIVCIYEFSQCNKREYNGKVKSITFRQLQTYEIHTWTNANFCALFIFENTKSPHCSLPCDRKGLKVLSPNCCVTLRVTGCHWIHRPPHTPPASGFAYFCHSD